MKLMNLKLRMAGTLAASALMLAAAAPAAAAAAQAWTWPAANESDLVQISAYRAMPSPSPELTGHQIEFESVLRPGVKGVAWVFCKPSLANCTGADFTPGATLRAQQPRAALRAGNSIPDFAVTCLRDARGQAAHCSAIGSLVPLSIGGDQ